MSERHGYRSHSHTTPEYHAWRDMRKRCRWSAHRKWHRYGGRGIKVCKRWSSFIVFLNDMGLRPTSGHTLERIDNDGDYKPSNCKWATQQEQQQNHSRNHKITAWGETLTITEWCRRSGRSSHCIRSRLEKGYRPEVAISAKHI